LVEPSVFVWPNLLRRFGMSAPPRQGHVVAAVDGMAVNCAQRK